MGYKYPNGGETHHSLEKMVDRTKAQPWIDNKGYETELFFVSKTKVYGGGDSRWNYFGNKYHKIFVDFKRQPVQVTLESGKVVSAYKIVGLQYNTNEWLHRDRDSFKTFTTLDEMIQSHKDTQQRIVDLVQ